MADNHHEHTVDQLRQELNAMREQMDSLLETLKDKKDELGGEVSSRLARELAHYRHLAQEQAHRLQNAGSAGMEEVSEQVRRNPMMSLLIAFGAGCVFSCLFRNLR